MIKRTTESNHPFIKKLYDSLHAFHIEGLTMSEDREFTAIVEAVQFTDTESLNIYDAFSEEEILAKYLIANELSIPLYFVCLKNGIFNIFTVVEEARNSEETFTQITIVQSNRFDEEGFVRWWAEIKKTSQTHPLNNGASKRTARTVFDEIIESRGYAWGGNIDAFIVDSNFERVLCIIDDISIGFVDIENKMADPGLFFHKRGPIYNTWLSTVKLANYLNVPHILLTKNANDRESEVVGITAIDHLDISGIYYVNGQTPPQCIVRGIENISNYICNLVSIVSPPIYK